MHGGMHRSMRPLAALERFLERLFERPTARLLRAHLEPVTLARRLERAMDEERRVDRRRHAGPHPVLGPGLARRTPPASPTSRPSRRILPRLALDHARRRGYRIPERPTVALVGSPELAPRRRPRDRRLRRWAAAAGPARRAPGDDAVHPLPPAIPPGAVLRVSAPGRPVRDVPLDGRPLTIGRATGPGARARGPARLAAPRAPVGAGWSARPRRPGEHERDAGQRGAGARGGRGPG